MIFELQTALKTKLESLQNNDSEDLFTDVYDYHTLGDIGYPYCTFELSSFEGGFLDSCTNIRVFKFNIVVLQGVAEDLSDRDNSKRIIYMALEKIIEALDGDADLGEVSIVKGDVSKGELGMIIEGEGKTLALDIELSLSILVSAEQ